MISVIVPIYNVEKYLVRCIESLLSQTYKDLELILVDDASPDQCGKICEEYAKKDPRIRVIHKKNGGLSDARNAGLDCATGDYIAFVDGDDYVYPNYLEELYNTIQKDNSDLVIGGFDVVDEAENILNTKVPDKNGKQVWTQDDFWNIYYEDIQNSCTMVAWNKLYTKKIFEKERYFVGALHEDEYICHKIISQCNKISIVNKPLYYYVQRGDSITSKLTIKNHVHLLKAYYSRMSYFKHTKQYQFLEKTLYSASLELVYMKEFKGAECEYGMKLHDEYKRVRKIYKYLIKKQKSKKLLKHGICLSFGLNFYSFVLNGYIKNKRKQLEG